MAHAHKTDFVFRRNGWVNLNRKGHQFSRLLAAEVCESAVVMLDTPIPEVVCRGLATHSTIHQFTLHFPSHCVTVCHHISNANIPLLAAETVTDSDQGTAAYCLQCLKQVETSAKQKNITLLHMRHLRFSQWWWWSFTFFGMWCCVN
jgi:hypothetical protein